MIWIIGGTSDARRLTEKLVHLDFRILVTTTTSYGSDLAKLQDVEVVQKALSQEEMRELIQQKNITTVVDASHPFAQEVSTLAMQVCAETNTTYVRFERPMEKMEGAKYYTAYEEMVSRLKQSEGDIFLSIGSKHVQQFEEVKSRIVARVLPVEESIHQCRAAGLQPHQIIAMKGLSSVETHRALFAEYQVKHLVSKDSGISGGLPEKVEAAKALGLQIHLLQRPSLHYPLVFTEIEKLIEYLQ